MTLRMPPAEPMLPLSMPFEAGIDIACLVRTLCALGQVERLEELGANGPLLASAGAGSLFHCLFGRDAIRMAFDLLDDFPAVAHATLRRLAELQGLAYNPRSEEEPGRILHEHRAVGDPHHARLARYWDFPYYGAVDSTPQWINLLAAYCARQGYAVLEERVVDREGRERSLRDCLLAALAWVLGRLRHPAGHGYLWVRRASPHGIANQVWEDSLDSHYHEDGSLFDVTQPYAPVAVQGYVYDALLAAADLLERSPGPLLATPSSLRGEAARLRRRVLEEFWQPDLGTFAQALTFETSGRPRPARVVASSPGHLLASQLLDGPDARPFRETLVGRLMQPDLLAGSGLRTKSSGAPRFRPGSYHNGSSWPMDTGVIADGLRRHGYLQQAEELERRILVACATVGGFPEFFRGDENGSVAVNTAPVEMVIDGTPHLVEQPPQAYQGWTVTRVWRILAQRGIVARAA